MPHTGIIGYANRAVFSQATPLKVQLYEYYTDTHTYYYSTECHHYHHTLLIIYCHCLTTAMARLCGTPLQGVVPPLSSSPYLHHTISSSRQIPFPQMPLPPCCVAAAYVTLLANGCTLSDIITIVTAPLSALRRLHITLATDIRLI